MKPYLYKDKYDLRKADIAEIKALIGVLYSFINAGPLYSWVTYGSGLEIFQAVMTQRRFRFLIRCLHFDNLETHEQRKSVENIAPIREIFEEANQRY